MCRKIVEIGLNAFLITTVLMFGTRVDIKHLNEIYLQKSLNDFGNADTRDYHVHRKEKKFLHNMQNFFSFFFVMKFILAWTCRLCMPPNFAFKNGNYIEKCDVSYYPVYSCTLTLFHITPSFSGLLLQLKSAWILFAQYKIVLYKNKSAAYSYCNIVK